VVFLPSIIKISKGLNIRNVITTVISKVVTNVLKTHVYQLGNSKAVLIPKSICDMLDLNVGSQLKLSISDNKIILEV
jgi:putative transposon-encoded protein